MVLFSLNNNLNRIVNFKQIIKITLPVAILSALIMFYENSNRPDAGLYHLPYISILNNEKISFGLANIHFRFALNSIVQYLSAIFYYSDSIISAISIPLSVIFSSILCFFLNIFFHKKNGNDLRIFSFFILFSILIGMNRYSSFGNDVPGHLFYLLSFFYTIFYFYRREGSQNIPVLNKVTLFSTFAFLIKPTLITALLFPLFIIFTNLKKIKYEKYLLVCFVIIIMWFFKNFIISSCFLYPSNITCIKTPWSTEKNIQGSPKKIESLAEAWSKGWPHNKKKNLSYEEFNKDFKWVASWMEHLKLVLKEIFPFTFLFILIFFKIISLNEIYSKISFKKFFYFIFTINFTGFIFWFIKFPIYRYGESLIISLILTLFIFLIFKIKKRKISNFNFLSIIIIFLIATMVFKNFSRIKNLENKTYFDAPWPKIYSFDNYNLKNNNIKVLDNKNNLIYYKPYPRELCYYSESPCTNIIPNDDIKVNKFIFGYKVYKNK